MSRVQAQVLLLRRHGVKLPDPNQRPTSDWLVGELETESPYVHQRATQRLVLRDFKASPTSGQRAVLYQARVATVHGIFCPLSAALAGEPGQSRYQRSRHQPASTEACPDALRKWRKRRHAFNGAALRIAGIRLMSGGLLVELPNRRVLPIVLIKVGDDAILEGTDMRRSLTTTWCTRLLLPLGLAASVAGNALAQQPGVAPAWSVTNLGTLDGARTEFADFNNHGQVVGTAYPGFPDSPGSAVPFSTTRAA